MVPQGHMDMDTENLLLIPTSEYINHPNATYAHMPIADWGDIQRDFATVFERRRTNVQVKKLCDYSWIIVQRLVHRGAWGEKDERSEPLQTLRGDGWDRIRQACSGKFRSGYLPPCYLR